jgi:hypothetical protein
LSGCSAPARDCLSRRAIHRTPSSAALAMNSSSPIRNTSRRGFASAACSIASLNCGAVAASSSPDNLMIASPEPCSTETLNPMSVSLSCLAAVRQQVLRPSRDLPPARLLRRGPSHQYHDRTAAHDAAGLVRKFRLAVGIEGVLRRWHAGTCHRKPSGKRGNSNGSASQYMFIAT